MNSTGVTDQEHSIRVKIGDFFVPRDLEIWWMTLKNNRAPLLYYIKLCASFWSHQWIQTWVIVRKRSICIKISDFLSCVTLKFDRWPWKTIGDLFFGASSLVHHFKAISEFKLELQSGNSNCGSSYHTDSMAEFQKSFICVDKFEDYGVTPLSDNIKHIKDCTAKHRE